VSVNRPTSESQKQAGAETRLLLHLAQGVSGGGRRIGIAVSGGSDSLALLHLAHQLAAEKGWTLQAVTVDHALREASAAEAAEVASICAGLGVPHETLRWEHGAIAGNLQDQARRARYRLLAEWARGREIAEVLIGHTADDQAETFLMGLSRAAGLDGLTGMRRAWLEEGVWFRRPLLAVPRAALRAYLTGCGVAWIEDPSNENPRFTRVKARRVVQALAPLGITLARLSETIQNLAEAQSALREAAAALWRAEGREEAGALHISQAAFSTAGAESQRRLVLAAIQGLAGGDYAPRGDKVATLLRAIAVGKDATLNGCRFRIKAGDLSIYRELNAVKGRECPTTELWDKRWQMIGPHAEGQSIRALGTEGLAACTGWRDLKIPRDALLVSPAIWQGATLLAAPLAGFSNGWQAKLRVSLNELILSH
jgi:tRNA(Ile)-lysidine synthase